MNFDALFQQILKSEQTAERRHNQLIQANKELLEYEYKIKEIKEAISIFESNTLTQSLNRLHRTSAELQVHTEQLKSLHKQRDKVKAVVGELKNAVQQKVAEEENVLETFMQEMKKFNEANDVLNMSVRERSVEDDVNKVRAQLDAEKRRLDEVRQQQQRLSCDAEQRSLLVSQIATLQANVIDADARLDDERDETAKKRRKLRHDRHEPNHDDAEFRKLQADLEQVNVARSEQAVRRLREELAARHRQQWHHHHA